MPDRPSERLVERTHRLSAMVGPDRCSHPQHPPATVVALPVTLGKLGLVVALLVQDRQVDEPPLHIDITKGRHPTQPQRGHPREGTDRIPEELDLVDCSCFVHVCPLLRQPHTVLPSPAIPKLRPAPEYSPRPLACLPPRWGTGVCPDRSTSQGAGLPSFQPPRRLLQRTRPLTRL